MAEFIAQINWTGIVIGFCTFLIIGLFHPLVIKGYYYLGLKCRWIFLGGGICSLAACMIVDSTIESVLLGVIAFSCFWSIKEVNEQKTRVEKGWFPANPKHTKESADHAEDLQADAK